MRDRGFVFLIVSIVLVFVVVIGVAVLMAKKEGPAAGTPDPLYVEVQAPGRTIPCVIYVNQYHPTNGAGISCDWSKR